MAKKKTKTKSVIKKIAVWLLLIFVVIGFVLTYAITALSS